MKMVIVHDVSVEGERIADLLQECGDVVVADRMGTVKAEMAAGPVFLMVSSHLSEGMRSRLPTEPFYTIPEPFSLVDAIKNYESYKIVMASEASVGIAENKPSTTKEQTVPPEVIAQDTPESKSLAPERVPFRTRRIPIVMFIAPKGGQGRTTACTHMAAYAAARAKRVAILDLDANSNAAEKFGETTQFASDGWRGVTIGDALATGAAVEAMPNVYVFSYGVQLERDVTHIDHADLQHVLGVCMEELDVVLIDTKQDWSPTHGFLLPIATQVVYVVAAQKDALDNLSTRTRDLERRMSGRHSDVYCILNQTMGSKDMDALAAYLLPYQPAVTIPFDLKYKQRGGLGLKALVEECAPWWDGVFGFPRSQKKKQWWERWFGRRGK